MSETFAFEIEQIRAACGARWLQKSAKPFHVKGIGIDSREDLAHKAFIAIKGDTHDGHDFLAQAVERGSPLLIVEMARASTLKVPAGVAVMQVDSPRKALGRIANAHRLSLRSTKVIAVTGSSGKTTTKRLIHGVLATTYSGVSSPKSFNNSIGVPLTLLSAKSSDKYAVVEIGTNAPGEIAELAAIAEPDIGVITMIGRSHLKGLGSIEGVAREKGALLEGLPADDGIAIVNADSPLLRAHPRRVKMTILFGESDDADLRLTDRGESDGRWWFEVNGRTRFELSIPGKHNALNALAAVAVGRRFGLDEGAIRAGLVSVQPEAMRMTPQVVGGVTFYNDAYNANPDSMIAALDTFAELAAGAPRRILVLGDMLELGEESPALHREIGERLRQIDDRCGIDHAVLIGEQMAHAVERARKAFGKDRLTHLDAVNDRAIAVIRKVVRPGDAVLLKASRGMELEKVIPAFDAPPKRESKRAKAVA